MDSSVSWPTTPGVYWFLDETGQVIYVGKAKNLRNRLNSYTRVDSKHPRTYKLVSTAVKLKYQELESDFEAVLIEAKLIQQHQPKYNINLKDDKSPLYIIITQEDFPRVLTARKKQLATVYKHISSRNIFGPFNAGWVPRSIIKTSRKIFKFCNASDSKRKLGKGCFYTHIELCSGACQGKVYQSEYNQMIQNLRVFLRGERKGLYRKLKLKMEKYSLDLEFEKAGMVRDQLAALDSLYSTREKLDFDPILPVLEEDVYQHKVNRLVAILVQAGMFPTGFSINRIEAYDISNTSGKNATASMVVFEQGKPASDEYRHFQIKTLDSPNDPAMLREALQRRLSHPEWNYPDLIVLDGGKGQLRAVLPIIDKIPTVSIAKRPDRLIVPKHDQDKLTYREFKLEAGKPVASLIQHLRDEAHRFAKRYHTKLRSRAMLKK